MIVTWSAAIAEDSVWGDILTELTAQIEQHPWFRSRARIAVALLKQMGVFPPARVLDAGCGWGINLTALENSGYRAVGLDVSRRALERLDRPGRELVQADLEQPLPKSLEPFGACLALDVIEHLDNDRAALANLAQVVKPGGTLIVSVPALPELFSDFDAVQGHRRRYMPDILRRAFAGTGLVLERLLWWGSWMVPLFKYQRRRSQVSPDDAPADIYRRYLTLPSWPARQVLRLAFAIDRTWTLRGRSRIGTSLFALARRPAG